MHNINMNFIESQKLKLGSTSREVFVKLRLILAFDNFLGIYPFYLSLKMY